MSAYIHTTTDPLENKTSIESFDISDQTLHYHQEILVKLYEKIHDKSKGLLLNHAMGTGKTILSAYLAESLYKTNRYKGVLIIANKSLENNYIQTLHKLNFNTEKYHFITLNSQNLIKKIARVDKTEEEIVVENKFGVIFKEFAALENYIVIVDEAHNLFNSIVNGSKNAIEFYDLAMNTKNSKFIFMSGTVMVNTPFELVPCFNMLRGKILEIKNGIKSYVPLFSEDRDLFDNTYIDESSNRCKNEDKFVNRIYGLTSYYNTIYFNETREGFPTARPTIVEKCPMKYAQFERYMSARIREIDQENKPNFGRSSGRFSSSKSISTFMIRSRQMSNFGMIFDENKKVEYTKDLIEQHSCKIHKMMQNVTELSGPTLIYSQFINHYGLDTISKALELYGVDTKQYAILSGDTDLDDRSKIIETFNSKDNKTLRILLISGAFSEGIDLKRINYVHILEPFFNYARIQQVETRANRYGSHIDLPDELKFTQTYLYVATYPESIAKLVKNNDNLTDETQKQIKSIVQEESTDLRIYKRSKDRMSINDQFMKLLAISSVDCFAHNDDKKIKCLMCNPTDKNLFNSDISLDIKLSNPCSLIEKSKIKAVPISYKNVKYYYDKTTGKIYTFDHTIQMMKVINFNSELYQNISNEINFNSKLHSV